MTTDAYDPDPVTQRRVNFGRINRRPEQGLASSPFREEMARLAALGEMRREERGRIWIAADLELHSPTQLDPGEFLTGMIGFEEDDERVQYDEEASSWLKSERSRVTGASAKAVVPFAVDLREERRWVAFARSPRIRPETFRNGLEIAINAARESIGFPTDWEVDLVVAKSTVEEWVQEHPEVRLFRRTVKLPNPGRSLSDDIAEMRAIRAANRNEQYTARRNGALSILDANGVLSETFADLIDGIENGQVQITLTARRPGVEYRFSTRDQADGTYIDEYGDDWELGVDLVFAALRDYSSRRAGDHRAPAQPTFNQREEGDGDADRQST